MKTMGRSRAKVFAGILTAVVMVSTILLMASGSSAASRSAAASDLFVQADTVLGAVNLTGPEMQTKVCVQSSRFAHNEDIVFRMRVMDPQTGQPMDDSTLQSVTVQLGDGTVLEARYGPHPGASPTDYFWAIGWIVPPGYPSGTLDFQIIATANDGRTGSFMPFNVGSSLLTITDQVRPVPTPPARP